MIQAKQSITLPWSICVISAFTTAFLFAPFLKKLASYASLSLHRAYNAMMIILLTFGKKLQ